jgi:hypothetical protein
VGIRLTITPQIKDYNSNDSNADVRKTIVADYTLFLKIVADIVNYTSGVTLRGFKKGSVIVNLDVDIPNNNLNWDTYRAIEANLLSHVQNKAGSIRLLEYSLTPKNFGTASGVGDSSSVNLGLILGVGIPLFLLFVMTLIVIKVKFLNKK